MSFFNKQSTDRSTNKPASKPSAGTVARETVSRFVSSGDNEISIIGPGMRITGDIMSEGTVRIEGYVEGTVQSPRTVVLGKSGQLVGNIIAQEAVIGGRVQGTVVAEGRLELQSTAVIEGEIRARAQHFQLDEGARFNGQIRMDDSEQEEEEMRALPTETAAEDEYAMEDYSTEEERTVS
jgi:cytoskeletal protein CcmA (bactofilin family)